MYFACLASADEIAQELGSRLKALRPSQGLQQGEPAARAGVSRATVTALENHGQQSPVHLMSAFATQARLVLGVEAVADKSNHRARLARGRPEWAGLKAVAMLEDSSNVSMRRRKMRAASNHDYRHQILFGQLTPEST